MFLALVTGILCTSNNRGTESGTNTEETEAASMYYTIDADGNLLDPQGNVIAEAGGFYIDNDGWIFMINGDKVAEEARVAPESSHLGLNLENAPEIKPIGFYIDDAGNLVDKAGNIKVKAGEYDEVDGYYVDKEGNRLGRILGKFAEIVKNAAEDVAIAFKDLFEKDENKGTTFTLQKMEWNPENHRIEDYSVKEIEALAAALKEHPESKIKVQAHTDDAGDKGGENKRLTSLRAEVVHNMLTTLGVPNKQISFKGMGSTDAAKAGKDVVEILVEN